MNLDNPTSKAIFIVSLVVIAAIATGFAVAIALYAHRKALNIQKGLEDQYLSKDLSESLDEALEGSEEVEAIEPASRLSASPLSASASRVQGRRRNYWVKGSNRAAVKGGSSGSAKALGAVFGILAVLLALILAGAVYLHCQDQSFTIGSKHYEVLRDDNMAYGDEANDYLTSFSQHPGQYDLVEIDTDISIEDVLVQQIVAIRAPDDRIVLSRVIRVYETEGDSVALVCRFDAVPSSYDYQIGVTQSDLVGIYTGYSSYGLGVLISFVSSPLGLAVISGLLLIVVSFYAAEISIAKAYSWRAPVVSAILISRPKAGKTEPLAA